MSVIIARQPNGLICRYSSIVGYVTDYNMTEEDYINFCKEIAELQAREILAHRMKDFSEVKEAFIPAIMSEEDIQKVMKKMELPKEQCKHTVIEDNAVIGSFESTPENRKFTNIV